MRLLQNILISIAPLFSLGEFAYAQEKKLLAEDEQFQSLINKFPGYCIAQGSPNFKFIALTFDDGPSKLTEQIFDLLDKHNVCATFFWQGQNLVKYPELVFKAFESGHDMGNHSWDHPNGWKMEPAALWKNQVLPTKQLYDSAFHMNIRYYRPPFGAISSDQISFLAENDQKVVLWSISTLDWDTLRNTSNEIIEIVRNELHPGAIILMHDVDFGNTASEKLVGLERIIKYAKAEGYEFVTITKLFDSPK